MKKKSYGYEEADCSGQAPWVMGFRLLYNKEGQILDAGTGKCVLCVAQMMLISISFVHNIFILFTSLDLLKK